MGDFFEQFAQAFPKYAYRASSFGLVFLVVIAEIAWVRWGRRKIYSRSDVWVNLRMFVGYFFIYASAIYLLMPSMIEFWESHALFPTGKRWFVPGVFPLWKWLILFVLVDFAFYVYHYCCHHTRLMWATHLGHHNSPYFNMSTGIRQPWIPLFPLFFWLPIVWIGFHPNLVVLVAGINLNFQLMLHTRMIPSLGPLEWVFNTPSHHRVHHACNPQYVNKNLGGVLIIWDRIFGTFAKEVEPPRYGIGSDKAHDDLWQNSFGEMDELARALPKKGGPVGALKFLFSRP